MDKEKKQQLIQELKPLQKIKGEERRSDLVFLITYLKKKEGEEAYKKLQQFLKQEIDFEIPDLEKPHYLNWIPASIPHVFMVAMVRFFDWQERDVFEMGRDSFPASKSMRVFFKFTPTTEYNIKKALSYWHKFYTWGRGELLEINKVKKEALVCIREFPSHPIVFVFLAGVFAKFLEVSSGSKKVEVKEVKLQGYEPNDHVFKLSW